jgi:hypothetical protein
MTIIINDLILVLFPKRKGAHQGAPSHFAL